MTKEEALQQKSRLRAKALQTARTRTEELYALYPELRALDDELSAVGPGIALSTIRKDRETLDALKEKGPRLLEKRAKILQSHGLRPDEDRPAFSCPKCEDTGYCLLELCDCVKSMLFTERYHSAGLGKGLSDKTFANFSMRYYGGKDADVMNRILRICETYADTFTKDSQSMLFLGKTGLGKTHLSAAIAGAVAQKGFFVLYESSQKLFDSYEQGRFGTKQDAMDRMDDYESCDLLLIDDLGAECASQYTAASFFNLLNGRLINGKPTIISTNLTTAALEKQYGERVLSRLLGEFRVLQFVGQDIRMQKVVDKA